MNFERRQLGCRNRSYRAALALMSAIRAENFRTIEQALSNHVDYRTQPVLP